MWVGGTVHVALGINWLGAASDGGATFSRPRKCSRLLPEQPSGEPEPPTPAAGKSRRPSLPTAEIPISPPESQATPEELFNPEELIRADEDLDPHPARGGNANGSSGAFRARTNCRSRIIRPARIFTASMETRAERLLQEHELRAPHPEQRPGRSPEILKQDSKNAKVRELVGKMAARRATRIKANLP